MQLRWNSKRQSGIILIALLSLLVCWGGQVSTLHAQPATGPAVADVTADPRVALDTSLRAALEGNGWTQVPRPIYRVRHSGPTPVTLEGKLPPVWYQSNVINGNSRPTANAEQEKGFTASIEAAYRGQTSLILGGEIVLVDSQQRIWAVGEHTPHLLRCYDGKVWSFRRADGLPTADDAIADFFNNNPAGVERKGRYAVGGLRDLDTLGKWFAIACQDTSGCLHFVGGSASEESEQKGAGGWGIHTLRPDGSWTFFRIYPVTLSEHEINLSSLRAVLHRPAAGEDLQKANRATQPSTKRSGGASGNDLVTLTSLSLSDPIAKAHGHEVIPIPPDQDRLRHQQWQDQTDKPRSGPTYLLRFDGKAWRIDRVSIGWGVYDMAFQVWPQPDGRVYIANRFGLWLDWPEHLWPRERIEKLINRFFAADEATQESAAQTLASLGEIALPAIREALTAASLEASRQRLRDLIAIGEAVVRGEQAAVQAIDGRWRFESVYPEATMPDGRFAFRAQKASDVLAGKVIEDCLVFFDPRRPEGEAFEVRAIDRQQWRSTDYFGKRAMVSARGSVIDAEGALWIAGGFRCNKEGQIERMVPPGLLLRPAYFVDPEGRVYADNETPNAVSMMVFRAGGKPDVAEAATTRQSTAATQSDEINFENITGLFRQSDLAAPWNAWALRDKDGRQSLLRLDGPEPTTVPSPFNASRILAVIPLNGGCIATAANTVGFWNGEKWDFARDVYALIERHGPQLATMAPTRVFADETSEISAGGTIRSQLMLASDGAGGLWLAEDSGHAGRRLCHWDGDRFTNLWDKLPLQKRRREDGGVMTIGGGRALIVQIKPHNDLWPGGYWAIWRVTESDVRERKVPLQTVRSPGLYPRLLTALGPNTTFSEGLWTDRQGWMWSPTFSDTGKQWVRRREAKVGNTGLPTNLWSGSLTQGPDGPIWFTTGKMRDGAFVWADIGEPTDERPGTYARTAWVGTRIRGMGPASQVVAAADGRVWLLHEGGISELRLTRLAPGERPPQPMRVAGLSPTTRPMTQPTSGPATVPANGPATVPTDGPAANPNGVPLGWAIEEIGRRDWKTPRNDFRQVAFDETGIWLRSASGPLIRVQMPKRFEKAAGHGTTSRPAIDVEDEAKAATQPATKQSGD